MIWMFKDVIFLFTKQKECVLQTWLSQIMKHKTSQAAICTRMVKTLMDLLFVSFSLIVSCVMSLVAVMELYARLLICGRSGNCFYCFTILLFNSPFPSSNVLLLTVLLPVHFCISGMQGWVMVSLAYKFRLQCEVPFSYLRSLSQ